MPPRDPARSSALTSAASSRSSRGGKARSHTCLWTECSSFGAKGVSRRETPFFARCGKFVCPGARETCAAPFLYRAAAMRIGVAREIKPREYRVALTPAGALELVRRGHVVMVEESAGIGSGFADDAYRAVGARIASVDEVWESSELLLKVKEPIAEEYERLRDELTLFTYLHIAADEPLTRALVESGVTGIAYETVETADRRCRCSRR